VIVVDGLDVSYSGSVHAVADAAAAAVAAARWAMNAAEADAAWKAERRVAGAAWEVASRKGETERKEAESSAVL